MTWRCRTERSLILSGNIVRHTRTADRAVESIRERTATNVKTSTVNLHIWGFSSPQHHHYQRLTIHVLLRLCYHCTMITTASLYQFSAIPSSSPVTWLWQLHDYLHCQLSPRLFLLCHRTSCVTPTPCVVFVTFLASSCINMCGLDWRFPNKNRGAKSFKTQIIQDPWCHTEHHCGPTTPCSKSFVTAPHSNTVFVVIKSNITGLRIKNDAYCVLLRDACFGWAWLGQIHFREFINVFGKQQCHGLVASTLGRK